MKLASRVRFPRNPKNFRATPVRPILKSPNGRNAEQCSVIALPHNASASLRRLWQASRPSAKRQRPKRIRQVPKADFHGAPTSLARANNGRSMTVYIRPNGDDKNDGSERTPVKSPQRAIAIANRNKDREMNVLVTDCPPWGDPAKPDLQWQHRLSPSSSRDR
jgi:hypothetical protein